MKYIMPLKAVILKQLEILLEKTLRKYLKSKEITDTSYIRAGFYDIALDLEFIIENIDLIQFKESKYNNCVERAKETIENENK